ncbi:hypothetical protein [Psychroserpens damuponensis]|uniref:hypothetical protein n=1 Tax=Psychroserpens damuponensis TaxID=943936 RepID=UPI00058E7C7E|nr:hypothetical protein [Psychroserpens damuponensis]
MKSNLILFICAFFFSCSIKGNFKGLYGYYNKSYKINPQLFVKNIDVEDFCQMRKTEDSFKIYISNGKGLKKCLPENEYSLLYVWGPNCKSDICIPLNLIQEECLDNKLDFFVVAEYYDVKAMQIDYIINRPIIGIDVEFYRTNLTKKYLNKFLKDVVGNEQHEFDGNRFLLFKSKKFIKSFNELDDLLNFKS